VDGRNPNGSAYQGTLRLDQKGHEIAAVWHVGSADYAGTGVIEGRVVTINWGDPSPVFYVVMPNGSLHGTWADGAGLEKLVPVR
jgi:hypothetical protein